MTDIVERLRLNRWPGHENIAMDAADEIERLRKDAQPGDGVVADEIERLRAALEDISNIDRLGRGVASLARIARAALTYLNASKGGE